MTVEQIAAGERQISARERPSLLVSVRDVSEASVALAAGVDVLDVKEPSRGALAAASVEVWEGVAELVSRFNSAPPLSAALGEPDEAIRSAHELPRGYGYAKAGPSGCRTVAGLHELWSAVRQSLPIETALVAVAYADHAGADSLPPEVILREAIAAGLRHLLIDTFAKDGTSTPEHVSMSRLGGLIREARGRGVWVAVAGSLRIDQLATFEACGVRPDCFGVRGDVCIGARDRRISPERVRRWRAELEVTAGTVHRLSSPATSPKGFV